MYSLGMKEVTTNPRRAERMVMTARAEMAARNTVSLLLDMARMAAMKKVLSPSSDTRITDRDSTKPWRKPLCSVKLKLSPSSSRLTL